MNEHLLYKTQNAKKKSKKKGVDVKWAVDNESYKQKNIFQQKVVSELAVCMGKQEMSVSTQECG